MFEGLTKKWGKKTKKKSPSAVFVALGEEFLKKKIALADP
jgi:hypothetical protein